MNIDHIRIEDRHRSDLGDLSSLAASIDSQGLLHPVVVTEDGRLIAGQRRLEACRTLGWVDVPVTVIADRADAVSLLHAERDENTCRKDMALSEKVALGLALEALEAPKAKERQGARTDLQHSPRLRGMLKGNSHNGEKGAIVGAAVGMTRSSYGRLKQVAVAAEAGDQSAVEALAEMDSTGKIWPAYRQWMNSRGKNWTPYAKKDYVPHPSTSRKERADRIRELADAAYSTRQIAATVGLGEEAVKNICRDFDIEVSADKIFNKTRRLDSNRVVTQTVIALEGLVTGVGLIDYDALDRAEAEHWATSLTDSLRVLGQFAKQIKEMT